VSETQSDLEKFGHGHREEVAWRGVKPGNGEAFTDEAELADIQSRIHQRLINDHDSGMLTTVSRPRLQELVDQATTAVLRVDGRPMPTRIRARVMDEVMNELTGYGPLQSFLEDPEVTEIMVNGPDRIFVERGGRIHATDRVFSDNAHVMRVIERIVAPLGRRVDEASPMVDARLPDGSRVNAIIPPLSIKGPAITVRKFARQAITAKDIVGLGTMSNQMLEFLQACVVARLNILVAGGTGGGKTTTLNVLSSFIPNDERIVTIEDAAELQLQQDHVVTLESRPANLEGKGEITIRMLVRNALRMRPDRIILGEVRGGEALDMLQAMNTGHDGSLCTVHSNSPRDSVARLETMTLMAGVDLPLRAIREQIASALHILVHQSRMRDGTRRVTQITEVQGMEGHEVVLQDIFRWQQQGVGADGRIAGKHRATGLRPRILERLTEQGVKLPTAIFIPGDNR
jgi:pilus assembly protein CpaF